MLTQIILLSAILLDLMKPVSHMFLSSLIILEVVFNSIDFATNKIPFSVFKTGSLYSN